MKFILFFLILITSNQVSANDARLFYNNKESLSRRVSSEDISQMQRWIKNHDLSEDEIMFESKLFLTETLSSFIEQKNYCDLYLPPLFISFLQERRIISEDKEVFHYLVFLRSKNLIDDLLYKLLADSTKMIISFESRKNFRAIKPANVHRRYSQIKDLEKMYQPFQKWPDEINSCTIQTYIKHINLLELKNPLWRNRDLKKLNWLAYEQKIISLETYNKLQVLNAAQITQWPITITRYIDIIKNAKDKKAQEIEEDVSNDFSSKYVLRKEEITRRGKLYALYNSTQVFLLSEIIERTARRMDAKNVELTFEFADSDTDREVYIFSPMEQYRISINMLKKEIAQLLRSENFKGIPFDYGDLIAAAYETGLLRSEEINEILKFEDFWNPQISRWKTYQNYLFSIAGTASYYLPPPWNILGAVGLIITQMKTSDDPKADPEDNWNSII